MGLMDELRRLARPYEDEDEEYDEELEEEYDEEEEEEDTSGCPFCTSTPSALCEIFAASACISSRTLAAAM